MTSLTSTIIRSPYPDVTIPEVSLPEFVFADAARRADKPALIDGPSGRAITYGELVDGARLVAGGLAAHGFGKGEVFAICCPNLPEYAVAFYGVLLAGGTARSGVGEVFVLGEAPGATPLAALLRSGGHAPEVAIDPHRDLATLPYSSGTTGLPKGVMLTHHNLVANLCQLRPVLDQSEADVVVAVLPLFHLYGQMVLLAAALRQGATLVTMPRFDLEQFLAVLQDYRVSRAFVVPPIMLALAKHPLVDRFDLSGLRFINSAAAPLSAELEQACGTRLECVVGQGYGLTETSPALTVHPPVEARIRHGSAGQLVPNTEAEVFDLATGQPLGRNQDGELCFRGPQIMAGYLNNPEATAQEVMAWVAERVAPYKKVRAVEFIDHIPKSPSGKILRRLPMEPDRQAAASPPG